MPKEPCTGTLEAAPREATAVLIWDWVTARRAVVRASEPPEGGPPPAGAPPEVEPPLVRVPATDDPRDPQLWGLALSGGGIRSATFSLGLVSGLAQKRIFNRFDLLSTVSGGGYAGSALGKLFTTQSRGPAGVQSALASVGATWFGWWLRATSRYLTPRGSKDMLSAMALYVRSLFAIHLELALAGLALGGVLALYNLAAWLLVHTQFNENRGQIETFGQFLKPWLSTLWVPIIVPVALAVSLAAAYWTIPSWSSARRKRIEALLAFAMALVGLLGMALVVLWPWNNSRDAVLKVTCAIASILLVLSSLGPVLAWLVMLRKSASADDGTWRSEQRNRLTRALAACLGAVGVLFVLGLVDRAAWFVAFEIANYKYLLPAVVAAGLVVFRTLAEHTQGRDQAVAVSGRLGMQIMSWSGVLLFAVLMVFWVSLVYRGALANLFGGAPEFTLDFRTARIEAAMFLVLPVAYMLLTGANTDFPNLASLHMFYRSRLMRSYLGATNRARFPATTVSGTQVLADPLARPEPDLVEAAGARKTVFDVAAGDNITLADYKPFAKGGPVHIINATLNQTMDPLGGLFNQDRKGDSVSITTGGQYRLGTEAWQPPTESLKGADVPTWTAISGAAFSPGLGGQTSTGLALLLFMAGVRLGYWWDMGAHPRRPGDRRPAAPVPAWAKYALLWGEARAQFGGRRDRYWYLTDGGHFENTAAYALLRERAQLVVVCDAAADPDYQFEDLENLVRKARIDLGTEIRFVDFSAFSPPGFLNFGSVDQLRDPASNACIALARVDYDDREDPAWLVYVKPNMFSGLPVDLVNYRRENAAFPQEPTTDQFFSESQWESYFKLGREIGMQLDGDLLMRIAANEVAALKNAPFAPSATTDGEQARQAASNPRSGISLRARNLAKSGLSIGAVIAALTAALNYWVQGNKEDETRQQNYAKAVLEAAKQDPDAAKQHADATKESASPIRPTAELPFKLVAMANEYCRDGATLVRRHDMIGKLVKDARETCSDPDVAAKSVCEQLDNPLVEKCLTGKVTSNHGDPVYWAIDYTDTQKARDRIGISLRSGPPLITFQAVTLALEPVWESIADAAAPVLARWFGGAPVVQVATAPPPRTTAAASAPRTAASATPPSIAEPPRLAACKDNAVYIQVFDEASREAAKGWEARLPEGTAKGVENVTSTAASRGQSLPQPVDTPVAIYHTANAHDCASAMMEVDKSVVPRPLGGNLVPTPGVVELWLPPQWGIVFGGDADRGTAQSEAASIAAKLGLPPASVFLKGSRYRGVSLASTQDQANQLLAKLKVEKPDAYLVRMSSWCLPRVQADGYEKCGFVDAKR